MTTTERVPVAESDPQPPRRSRIRTVLAFLRNTWRGLTSMRTALLLLFLLALGALPGALLPQTAINPPATQQYITDHGWWGQLLNRLQFFDVYGSVWFSAIYVLLFVSLVGCLAPRSLEYARQLRARPVLTPRNLSRLPHYVKSTVDEDPKIILEAISSKLRGWRKIEHVEAGGIRSISAERGYLRETGNLLFHFAMLGLIVAFALGKMFSYSGEVIVQANGSATSQFCNSGVLDYDSFTPGLRVDGTNLAPFCVKVNDFNVTYLANGQPDTYSSNIQYQTGNDLASNTWVSYNLAVNAPLRTAGDRVYLAGHGYSPQFTVTFPNGQTRTGSIQWKEDDPETMLSEGATKFDPPGITDPKLLSQKQLAITGLFAPTAIFNGNVVSSLFPALDNPVASVFIYQGDLGLDSGVGQSIFSIDQNMVNQGKLRQVAAANLTVGQTLTLSDGTKIHFDGVGQWVSLLIAHDPTQDYVLIFAVALLLGLGVSLMIKRRRLWIRVTPTDSSSGQPRTVVEIGGLARTDQAGYGEEFTKLSQRLRDAATSAAGNSVVDGRTPYAGQ